MRTKQICFGFAASLLIVGCANTPKSPEPEAMDITEMGAVMGGDDRSNKQELEALSKTLSQNPLGGKDNPIRVFMPSGQQAYLSRLRCSDNRAPKYRRVGNAGLGVYGSILDIYAVTCADAEPAETSIWMDMYHPDYLEENAPEGFTITPASQKE